MRSAEIGVHMKLTWLSLFYETGYLLVAGVFCWQRRIPHLNCCLATPPTETCCPGSFKDSPVVLLVPADLPLITPFSGINFLMNCGGVETSYDAAILWAMIPEESFTGHFAKVTKGYNRFRDVAVCHGNLLLMTPSILQNQKIVSRINAVYEVRKSSVSAAMAAGLFVGAVYAVGVHFLRAMTLKQTARILSRHLAVEIIPVLLDHPEVAVDIDTPGDYLFVQEHISWQDGDSLPAG